MVGKSFVQVEHDGSTKSRVPGLLPEDISVCFRDREQGWLEQIRVASWVL
jgi:hypothetical protein